MDPQLHLIRRLTDAEQLPLTAYHYTTESSLRSILTTRAMWATDIRHLDDSKEFLYTLELVRDRIARLRGKLVAPAEAMLLDEWRRALGAAEGVQYYVISFSAERDSASQWKRYAGPAGYALGLDQVHLLFIARAHPGAIFLECVYEEQAQLATIDYGLSYLLEAYRKRIKNGLPSRGILMEFGAHFFGHVLVLASCFKRPEFKPEHEWRLAIRSPAPDETPFEVKTRVKNATTISYIDVPIATESSPVWIGKLIVGPSVDPAAGMAKAFMLLADLGFEAKEVALSALELADI